ncbi:MAG TPA: CBS domain-containing protein, partial [Acidimicrobiia bacterium]
MAVAEPVDADQFGTAEQHVCTDVPRAGPAERAGAVRAALVGRAFESAVDVAVTEGERLVGLVTIEALLAAPEDATLGAVMDDDPPIVTPGVDQEIAAWHAVRHGESSLAVVDDTGRFVGLIPPTRMLTVLLEEHDEDMARLGGYLASTARAR